MVLRVVTNAIDQFDLIDDYRKELRILRKGSVLIQLFTTKFMSKYDWVPLCPKDEKLILVMVISRDSVLPYPIESYGFQIVEFDDISIAMVKFYDSTQGVENKIKEILKNMYGLRFWNFVDVEISIVGKDQPLLD